MSNRFTILVVEDDRSISNFISTVLMTNDYTVLEARDASEALRLLPSHCPDAMILDLGLPDMDGQHVIDATRQWSQMPIIVVSARSQEKDKIHALDFGADDYLTKPFSTGELLARLRAALRRAQSRRDESGVAQPGHYRAKDLHIDYAKRKVSLAGEEVKLTQTEYNILCLLSQYAGRVLTYDYILKQIWGPLAEGSNQILRVNMANIRRKVEENPAEPGYIFTEMGVGYRMLDCE